MELLSEAICQKKYWKGGNIFLDSDFDRICKEIKEAEKFVLDPEITKAMAHISVTKPSSILSHLEFSRCPYPKSWFEFDYKVRNGSLEEWIHDTPDKPTPQRVGFLVHSDSEGDRGIAHLFWQFGDGATGASPIAVAWDNRATPDTFAQIGERYKQQFKMPPLENREYTSADLATAPKDETSLLSHYSGKTDREAMIAMTNRAVPCYSFFFKRLWDIMDATVLTRPQHSKTIRAQIHSWLADWNGELRFFYAILSFLNVSSGTEYQSKDMTERNQNRYRQGKPPFHSYKILKLKLTKQQEARARAAGITDNAEMRLHLVRGHHKNRATGRFWWAAFPRGNADAGTINKDYVVV